MYLLENELRHYAWGSKTAMARLFERPASGEPEAELWIGAHPDSPSRTRLDGQLRPLDNIIANDPAALLGASAADRFDGLLPFLLKVLAADAPLSLQVHPTRHQAQDGFAAENAAGIARDDGDRNYRDDNHKPELLFALTPFTALCGFRPVTESADLLDALDAVIADAGSSPAAGGRLLPELASVLRSAAGTRERETTALQTVFRRLISNNDDVAEATADTARALGRDDTGQAPMRDEAEADQETPEAPESDRDAAIATVALLTAAYPGDPGALVSLLLNRVALAPGEAIYLPAGYVHAYLKGLGIEVMASSDNVLRGGLTSKHIDIAELMKTVEFRPQSIPKLAATPDAPGQEIFQPPVEEFQLQRLVLAAEADASTDSRTGSRSGSGAPVAQNGPAVLLAVRGAVVLESGNGKLRLEQGQSAFLASADAPVTARSAGATHPDPMATPGPTVNSTSPTGNSTIPTGNSTIPTGGTAPGALAFAVTVSTKEDSL